MIVEAHHKTLVFKHILPAPPVDVFQAHADARQRSHWAVPSDTAVLIYDEAHFAIGGTDRFRCGSKDDPKYRGTTYYLDIAPGSRIVSSEVIAVEATPLSAALTTLELTPRRSGTSLKMTVQVASFAGPDLIKGHEQGYNGALDNLARYLARRE
jgi:uncharacterized protein YndB with AHSA1/START domain